MTEPSSNAPKAPGPKDSSQEKTSAATKPLPVTAGSSREKGKNEKPADELDHQLSEQEIEDRIAAESLERNRKKRRKRRIVGICVAAAVVLLALIFVIFPSMTQPSDGGDYTQQTVSVMREDFKNAVTASGNVQPVSSVVVTPEVDGIISEVNVAEGSVVTEGDVLLTIKNDSLDKSVREAKTALDSANKDVSQAWDSYNATVTAYNAGEVDYNATVDAANAVDSANATLQSAQESYDEAVATADKRTVRAPASGSVIVMNAVSGASTTSTSTSGQPLIQIADVSQMTVKVQVNEVDIPKIAVGQKATVTFSALPDVTSEAEVTRIATVSSGSGSGDSMSYGGSGSSVTYDVELLIPQPPEGLKPGMTANVEIALQDVPNALTIPSSCIATDADGATYVMRAVYDEQGVSFERVDVTVVASDNSTSAVEGELQEGDEVALSPDEAGGGDVVAYETSSTDDAASTTAEG
ncbi:MAG: efflux RND transporter periplasmic adaptor subunit [Tractidigestivibacter sp.]|uniref:efflux RND transporter periplasmic adaptor subunit n=1 Tax=Tractidigestivibacter sp. TaxID=2847320 RepID=UPI003D8A0EF8